MSYLSILILAFALSIDALVVSFTYGIKYDKNTLKNSLLLAIFTGGFQGLMPALGYYPTFLVKDYILPYANLIVFLIFSYLGFKFIIESNKKIEPESACIDLKCLILIGIATSIDAFSAGITLSLCGTKILKPALLIAVITFINSNIGFFAGRKLRNFSVQKLSVFGGILLIILAIKAVIF